MNRSFIFLFILIFSLFFSFNVKAQGVPVAGGGIDLSVSSDSPAPGQKISITARSFSISINSANITWTVDGKVVQKGIGLTTLEISAPALGKITNVVVTAVSTDGTNVSNSVKIGSGSVDLIIENNGFLPPIFKGKVPTAYQNTVSIIAIPHIADAKGVEYDPKNLVYQWKKSSRVVEEESGYGKQKFTLLGDIVPRTANISVTVSTRDNSRSASGMISVTYNSPSLNFYTDDPLYGPFFNKTINESLFIGKEKEVSVLAIPYGFNKPISGLGNLGLNWMVNGFTKPELAENESITLRAPDGSDGTSNVELTISNKKDILQNASNNFSVRFSSKSSNSNAGTNF